MSNSVGQIDTYVEIITPENTAFQYQLAGPFRRLPAYFLDVMIRVAACLFLGILFALIFGWIVPGISITLWLLAWFVLDWFYGGLFETFWNGQTPGKRLTRIRVVSIDGQPINGLQAILRNILRTLDGFPVLLNFLPLCQLGLLTTFLSPRFQRLGDLASRTMVVVEQPPLVPGVTRIDEPEAIRLASSIPFGFRVSGSLSLALSSYVLRRKDLPWVRRLEIARHLAEPLRITFGLPADTNYDLLLCALYHRTFFAHTDGQETWTDIKPQTQTAVTT